APYPNANKFASDKNHQTQITPPTEGYNHQNQNQYQTKQAPSPAQARAHTYQLATTTNHPSYQTTYAGTNPTVTHYTSHTGKHDTHSHSPYAYTQASNP